MAIIYNFSCSRCNYQVELKIGLNMMEHYRNDPDVKLASCDNCKVLSTTNNKHCATCNAKAETGKWFSRKTGFKILNEPNTLDSKIPCPKCKFQSLEAIPMVFLD